MFSLYSKIFCLDEIHHLPNFDEIFDSYFAHEIYFLFHKTPLICAVENENAKIVQLLLSHSKIDVNTKTIFNQHLYDFKLVYKCHFK